MSKKNTVSILGDTLLLEVQSRAALEFQTGSELIEAAIREEIAQQDINCFSDEHCRYLFQTGAVGAKGNGGQTVRTCPQNCGEARTDKSHTPHRSAPERGR